ncbi:hypothetical protein VNO80_06930 [Phaseolus coccineus]|uniref:Uncharacterized protein n=1 Tax=Phaseolus coccineus TaxID=3886 RepID=A0AAN9RJE3_PHACN
MRMTCHIELTEVEFPNEVVGGSKSRKNHKGGPCCYKSSDLGYKSIAAIRIDVVVLLFLMGREREMGRESNNNSNMALPCGFVMTKSVWSYNLESEFELIRFVIALYHFISMDTKFLRVVFQSHPTFGQP